MKYLKIENFFLTLIGCQLGVFTEKNFCQITRRITIDLQQNQINIYEHRFVNIFLNLNWFFLYFNRARRNSMNPSHIDSHEIKARKSMKKTITKID